MPDIAFTVQITPEKNREARIEYSLENKRASIPVSGISFDLLRGVKPEAFGGEAAMMVGSRTFPLNELTSRHSLYAPQLLTHNMAAVYGDGKVLYSYLAQEHPLDARADFGRGDDGIFCRLTVYPQVKPAEKYTLGPIMIGAARGDWKAAADRFRTWWKSWADKPLIPEWFQSMGGLVVCQPENIADFTEKTGIRTGHSGSWLPRQTEGWYPLNYLLGDAWAEAWRERIAAAQKQGGKVSLYSNPLMSSRVIPDTEEISMKYAVREKDGFPVYSEHTHRHHPMVLPALSEAYAKIYLRYLSPAIDALKPDVLYMDQIGAVPLHVDYQPENKGNRNFCEWSDGQARISEFCGCGKFFAVAQNFQTDGFAELLSVGYAAVENVFAPLVFYLAVVHYPEAVDFEENIANLYFGRALQGVFYLAYGDSALVVAHFEIAARARVFQCLRLEVEHSEAVNFAVGNVLQKMTDYVGVYHIAHAFGVAHPLKCDTRNFAVEYYGAAAVSGVNRRVELRSQVAVVIGMRILNGFDSRNNPLRNRHAVAAERIAHRENLTLHGRSFADFERRYSVEKFGVLNLEQREVALVVYGENSCGHRETVVVFRNSYQLGIGYIVGICQNEIARNYYARAVSLLLSARAPRREEIGRSGGRVDLDNRLQRVVFRGQRLCRCLRWHRRGNAGKSQN